MSILAAITSFLVTLFTAPLDIVYAVKWIISYISINIYKACRPRRFDLYDVKAIGNPVKLGFIIPQIEKDLESPFPESHLQNATDEVLFYGVNSKSECVLLRIARGCNQTAEAWIYLKLANGKTYHLSEHPGYQAPFEGKCPTFSCGNFHMHYLRPMRTWRIFYCGMLKEASPDKKESEELVFVKFVFLWKASSDVYDLSLDTNPGGFAAALARANWKFPLIPPVNDFVEAIDFYAQAGVVTGTISVNEGSEYEMYLFGEKMRGLGKSANVAGCNFTNILGNTPQTGLTFHLGQSSVPFMFHNLPYGFVVQPGGDLETVKDLEISIKPLSQEHKRHSINAHFLSNEKYKLKGEVISDPIVFYSDQGWSGFLEVSFIEFIIGDMKGSGIVMSGEVYKEAKRSSEPISTVQFPTTVPLTVQFADDISHFGDVSGGKGSSLGKLTQLRKQKTCFTVPNGIIVTTAAFSEFLTTEISNSVQHLENIAYGNIEGDIKSACNLVSGIIERTALPNKICHSIIQDLKDIFGDEINCKKFAVRSSATGEDTSAMSAAGQMDTFLGIQGLKEIFVAVKKCWASQFGYIAVEYKRRNGQILNSPMAVVIQEMVASEVSGVLFTCDPVTNNPSFITITANYGLGETVVSGAVEPDTIMLRRKDCDQLAIESVTIGAKRQRMVMQESGGTLTEDLPENSRHESCLSEETALRLGKLAIEIEKFYKSPRDIEWAIVNNEINILQSRPVTNIAGETDFEVKHEFDSTLPCEREFLTKANVGEVMPGATPTLSKDLVTKAFGTVIKRQAIEKGYADTLMKSQYFNTGLTSFYNHVMFSVTDMLNRYGVDTLRCKGIMISIFGRVLDDPDLLEYTREKEKLVVAPAQSIKTHLTFYRDLFFHAIDAPKVKERLENYHMNFMKTKTADEAFDALIESCSDFDEALGKHMTSSESSSEWNMYIFTLLCSAKGGFDTDVFSDFARLLGTSSNAESAEVPQTMLELALQIGKDLSSEAFKLMTAEEAGQWLQTSSSPAGQKFRQFLKRHGHRCLREFDIRSITWGMDPKLLVKILQNLVGTCTEDDKMKNGGYDKLFAELHVPLNFWYRCMLKFILPNCHRAVCGREAGKSLSIKGFDYWRKGFRHLAKLMVSEGRIPDADLIYFFTIDEIDELLKTRSPSLISRANYRRKLYPTLDGYVFPEIMKGMPKPVNDEDESSETYEFVADLTMKGTPVSQGVTKGFARVALSMEEAALLKPGEILITYSTDIGWSPYFPIISGVVTEIGGLISHGAVVSREYGLPCVVGLAGATRKFRTGDYVLLDGKKGVLQRLPQPE